MASKNVSFASWVQALSTLALVILAIWAGFFSKAGGLAVERLQLDLFQTKQQLEFIRKKKEELEAEKLQIQHERNELVQLREDHLTNIRLRALWEYGLDILSAYESEAKVGQGLLDLDQRVESSRNWLNKDWNYKDWLLNKEMPIEISWRRFYLPDPEKDPGYGKGAPWRCSISTLQILEDSFKREFDPEGTKSYEEWQEDYGEWEDDRNMDYLRDLVDRQVLCFNEWEHVVRQRIESTDDENVFTVEDFLKKLLQLPAISDAGEKISKRIKTKLTVEISNNTMLANLPIQLRVTKEASLQEIEEEAEQIIGNVKIARGWLGKATSDRYTDIYTCAN